jgi:hypothetical protein
LQWPALGLVQVPDPDPALVVQVPEAVQVPPAATAAGAAGASATSAAANGMDNLKSGTA